MPIAGKTRYIDPEFKLTPQGRASVPKPITDDEWDKIAEMLKIGGNLKDAAAYAGISYGRLYRNIDAEKHLKRRVAKIMAKCKKHHLQRVYDGERGWQSSAWFLERMYRKEYSMSHGDNSEEEKAIQIRKMVRRTGPIPKGAEETN